MVKGVSRQVIVVHSPDPKLFEQAIFILKDGAVGQAGITDEMLLKEAKRIVSSRGFTPCRRPFGTALLWTACGAFLTGMAWILTLIL